MTFILSTSAVDIAKACLEKELETIISSYSEIMRPLIRILSCELMMEYALYGTTSSSELRLEQLTQLLQNQMQAGSSIASPELDSRE